MGPQMLQATQHIVGRDTPMTLASAAPDSWNFMTPRPMQLALPSDANVRRETEARSSTSLLTHNSASAIHCTMNLVWASGSSGFTKNVACTSICLRSIVLTPMASFISNTSPIWCSPFCCQKEPQIRTLRHHNRHWQKSRNHTL